MIEPPNVARPDPVKETPAPTRFLGEDPVDAQASARSIFDLLVENEHDLVGMVAFSLHELSRRDWLKAFRDNERRDPEAAELQAFIIGERTGRRLALYRQEAETALLQRALPRTEPLRHAVIEPASLLQVPASTPGNRSKMGDILHHLVGAPAASNSAASNPAVESGMAASGQPGLRMMFKYLVLLLLLVGALAIVVNYAKTFFAN